MAVRATVARFPSDPDEQETSGLPWGVTITPFCGRDENGLPPSMGSDGENLPRCENCWAYFNSYCELDQWAWNCSLCGTLNGLSAHSIAKYSHPQSCPEMSSSFIDLELPCKFQFYLQIWILLLSIIITVITFDGSFCFNFSAKVNQKLICNVAYIVVVNWGIICSSEINDTSIWGMNGDYVLN